MRTLHFSNTASNKGPITDWQLERERRLQRICEAIQSRLEAGQKLEPVIRRFSKRHNCHPFKTNPDRKLALSASTLLRLWYAWLAGGRVPSAFRLNYRVILPSIPASLLMRFVGFCASRRFPNMRTAWQIFARRGGAWGAGRPGSVERITYNRLQYYFPASKFRLLQAQLTAIDTANDELARLRLDFTAEIQNWLPARTPRRLRRWGAPEYQI